MNVETFEEWRNEARRLLARNVAPDAVSFGSVSEQPLLDMLAGGEHDTDAPIETASHSVPKEFLQLAETVAYHRDPQRWNLMYRTLWRLTHGERHLLNITTDDDVYQLYRMQKSVSRDVHKMKAFVRFRKVASEDDVERFVAWHRSDHRILRLAAPFFSRRFKAMHWTILTPNESVTWDHSELTYGPGVPANDAPDGDALEELWKTYYASIFNPARIKVETMRREMPTRYWPTMPETKLIPELLAAAPQRVEEMIERHEGFAETAVKYIPSEFNLASLRVAAAGCRACDLCERATQTVFGIGPADAKVVIVGEQPGDEEDLAGQPFVGPAGRLLGQAFVEAGMDRSSVYVTNAVKHFSFVDRGKRRLHKKPSAKEIFACRPWLEAELLALRPEVVVCLGATAAQVLLGRDFRLTDQRGREHVSDWCPRTIATWHPAAILRTVDPARKQEMFTQLVGDLQQSIA